MARPAWETKATEWEKTEGVQTAAVKAGKDPVWMAEIPMKWLDEPLKNRTNIVNRIADLKAHGVAIQGATRGKPRLAGHATNIMASIGSKVSQLEMLFEKAGEQEDEAERDAEIAYATKQIEGSLVAAFPGDEDPAMRSMAKEFAARVAEDQGFSQTSALAQMRYYKTQRDAAATDASEREAEEDKKNRDALIAFGMEQKRGLEAGVTASAVESQDDYDDWVKEKNWEATDNAAKQFAEDAVKVFIREHNAKKDEWAHYLEAKTGLKADGVTKGTVIVHKDVLPELRPKGSPPLSEAEAANEANRIWREAYDKKVKGGKPPANYDAYAKERGV